MNSVTETAVDIALFRQNREGVKEYTRVPYNAHTKSLHHKEESRQKDDGIQIVSSVGLGRNLEGRGSRSHLWFGSGHLWFGSGPPWSNVWSRSNQSGAYPYSSYIPRTPSCTPSSPYPPSCPISSASPASASSPTSNTGALSPAPSTSPSPAPATLLSDFAALLLSKSATILSATSASPTLLPSSVPGW